MNDDDLDLDAAGVHVSRGHDPHTGRRVVTIEIGGDVYQLTPRQAVELAQSMFRVSRAIDERQRRS